MKASYKSTLTQATRKPRGNSETPGQSIYGDINSDIVDLDVVVKYLKSKYGYAVTMIVSHSRATTGAMRYLCSHEEVAADVKSFVNVAGRYTTVRPVEMPFWNPRFTHLSAFQDIDRK